MIKLYCIKLYCIYPNIKASLYNFVYYFWFSCSLGWWLRCVFLRSKVSWPSRPWCVCWGKKHRWTSNANWRFNTIFVHVPHNIFIVFSFGPRPKLICPPCTVQVKVLSMTDQFTLPNTQYMISTMATIGFYSKPLLDICSKKIIGNLFNCYTKKILHVHMYTITISWLYNLLYDPHIWFVFRKSSWNPLQQIVTSFAVLQGAAL